MRLNQVTLGCTDYTASCAFYRALGLRQIVDAPPRYARFETPTGETLSIHAVEIVTSRTLIYFECDDVDATVAALKAKHVPITQEPRDESWLWREARLFDPAGNEILPISCRRKPPLPTLADGIAAACRISRSAEVLGHPEIDLTALRAGTAHVAGITAIVG